MDARGAGERGSASIRCGPSSGRIFMFGQFENFVASSRAPSRLIEVDSALGGLMERNVSLDMGGGGGLLDARGGLFQMGVEIPSSSRADCGMRGRFFSAGSHELTILVTQWQAHVKLLCHCIVNRVGLNIPKIELLAIWVGGMHCVIVTKLWGAQIFGVGGFKHPYHILPTPKYLSIPLYAPTGALWLCYCSKC